MSEEFHISSFIVQTKPEQLAPLTHKLAELPGVEVHQSTPEGKIIVTLECLSTREISETTSTINQLPGVLSCNMVFHQIEQEAANEPVTFKQPLSNNLERG